MVFEGLFVFKGHKYFDAVFYDRPCAKKKNKTEHNLHLPADRTPSFTFRPWPSALFSDLKRSLLLKPKTLLFPRLNRFQCHTVSQTQTRFRLPGANVVLRPPIMTMCFVYTVLVAFDDHACKLEDRRQVTENYGVRAIGF